jgi:antitoxin VapB
MQLISWTKRVIHVGPRFWTAIKLPLSVILRLHMYIHSCIYISRRRIMAIARVFKSGNSQAVRLPKKFRVKSSEVEIFRRGDEIVLREKAGGMVRVLDLLAELPADMFPKKRKDPQPQRRKGL